MIKKQPLFKIVLLLFFIGIFATPIFAQNLGVPGGSIPYPVQRSPIMDLFRNNQIGDIIKSLLPFVFVVAGLIMFGQLVWGGFQIMTSSSEPKGIKEGQERITHALIGFFLIFAAYWLIQIIQFVFNISIVSPR